MTELPVVAPRQLIRALQKAGFFVHHVRGSHYYLKHPDHPALRVTVPYHAKDVKRGTLRAILHEAGISVDQLVALL
ncbi:MAG TPA: type II toxin-antitoxin system HicA family toxin [Stellaceae bacterium]|nr:type II toxin-antitoxin system HicA family toxin [Stellaceae bacterium]